MMWFIHLEIVIILGKRHLNRYLDELNMKCDEFDGARLTEARQRRKEVANRFGSQSIQLISREALPLYKRQKMLPLIFGRMANIGKSTSKTTSQSNLIWHVISSFAFSSSLTWFRFFFSLSPLQSLRNEGIEPDSMLALVGGFKHVDR